MYFEGYQNIELDELRNGIETDSIAHYVKDAEESFKKQNYAMAEGKLFSAIKKFEHCPQGHEMVLAKLYFNLALANHFHGNLIHAEENCRISSTHFEKVVGANTIEAADFNEFVADYLQENGPWEAFGCELITEKDILELYLNVMSVKEELLDPYHPDRAAIYFKVRMAYSYDEQYQNALKYFDKAYSIFVKHGDEKKAQDVMKSYNCMKRDMERE